MLKSILKDIKDLENKEVTIFGQKATLSGDESLTYTPRVKNLIQALEDYEVMKEDYEAMMKAYDEEDSTLEVVKGYNTYNWNGSIDHHINFNHIKYNEEDFIMLKIHRYGDVRSNYTVEAIVKMDVDGFFHMMMEYLHVYDSIEVDGINYQLSIYATNEAIEVYNPSNEESFEIYTIPEEEDMKQAIKERLKELKAKE
jgi:hypothetical protein